MFRFLFVAVVILKTESASYTFQDVYADIIESHCAQYLDLNASKCFGQTSRQNHGIIKKAHREKVRKCYQTAMDVLNVTLDDIIDGFKPLPSSGYGEELWFDNGMVRGEFTPNNDSSNLHYVAIPLREITSYTYTLLKHSLVFLFHQNGTLDKSIFVVGWEYWYLSNSTCPRRTCYQKDIKDKEESYRLLRAAYGPGAFTFDDKLLYRS